MNQIKRTLQVAGLLFAGTAAANADGTETLAAPAGLTLADGTGILFASTGLADLESGLLTLAVPENVQVLQVIAYWDGLALNQQLPSSTDTIFIGGVPVTGNSIGGPSNFIGAYNSFAYRADVTSLGLLEGLGNVLEVEGLDFGYQNNGLSLVLIVDDGSGARTIDLRDGSDFAFGEFAAPYNTTETQVYEFEPSASARDSQLSFIVSGVQADRPNTIEVTVGDQTFVYADLLGSSAGPEWDVVELDLTIPANTSQVSARVLSADSGNGEAAGGNIASLNWIVSTFELEQDGPGFGCSPYFWYSNLSFWDPWCRSDNKTQDVVLTDRFNKTFGVHWYHSGLWSKRRLWHGIVGFGFWCSWKQRMLNRHAVTALANADSDMGYPYTVDEVKALYRDAVGADSGPETINSVLAILQEANNLGCPW